MTIFIVIGTLFSVIACLNISMYYDRKNATKSPYYEPRKIK
jgi:hypothetical protein